MLTRLSFLVTFVFFLFNAGFLYGAHGISIDGKLKYPAGFKHFDYVSANAGQGGDLSLHDNGSFDKMNPFTLKGTAPFGLDMFVFETLAVASLDEPFAEYGLIAKDIELAENRMSVTFTLHDDAMFSDGSSVTAEDVKFSLDILKSDKVHPFYPYYYQDIKEAKILGERKVQFLFNKTNRELHMVAAQLPVMSKAFYTSHSFSGNDGDNMAAPMGSGPYIVSKVIQGKSISYKKNPAYWAADHPTRKGLFNFETITVHYYKDQIVAVRHLKPANLTL